MWAISGCCGSSCPHLRIGALGPLITKVPVNSDRARVLWTYFPSEPLPFHFFLSEISNSTSTARISSSPDEGLIISCEFAPFDLQRVDLGTSRETLHLSNRLLQPSLTTSGFLSCSPLKCPSIDTVLSHSLSCLLHLLDVALSSSGFLPISRATAQFSYCSSALRLREFRFLRNEPPSPSFYGAPW